MATSLNTNDDDKAEEKKNPGNKFDFIIEMKKVCLFLLLEIELK